MLQIRLSKQAPDIGGVAVAKPHVPVDTVTVACPDHLVLADLPVAKGIGAATTATTAKTVGRRSRRLLGERVHFCVRCDFPIAIYGRLSPCEHAFCLDCARSDSICYLCDERIQKIQTIKLMEGIFICAAPHCLKSFLKRIDFESHIHTSHSDLLQPNGDKEDGNESDVQSTKQPATSDSRAFQRPLIHSGSNSQLLDNEEKARRQQPRELPPLQKPLMQQKPPFFGQTQNIPSDNNPDNSRPPGFDWPGHNPFQQSMQGAAHPESINFAETQMPEYPPMHSAQPPNFSMPMNSTPSMAPQFGVPPFLPEGAPPFYGSPYEMGQMTRPDSAPQEVGVEQGSLLGYPQGPGPARGMNFVPNYPPPWNAGPPPPVGHASGDGFSNPSDSQGNPPFYQGDYGRNPGVRPVMPGAPQSTNPMDPRDSRGISAPPQQFQHPPPPPPPLPHPTQHQQHRGKYYLGDRSHDAPGFGWQHESRDSYGSGQD